jgi:DnaJ-class molecular chaperone
MNKARRFFSTFDHNTDYYKILGVKKSADQKQIRLGYYTMAKKFHPDLNADVQGAEYERLNVQF